MPDAAVGSCRWLPVGCSSRGATSPPLSAGQAGASKAAYRLLGSAAVTPEALQEPHQAVVRQALQAPGTWLLVEDTTELRWPEADERRPGLGPVGSGKAPSQGVLLHSLVAAAGPTQDPDPAAKRPALPLLGLMDQQFHVRQPVPPPEKTHPHGGSRLRQGRARESALCSQSLRHAGSPPPDSHWVVVADRGAAIDEHLPQCQAQGLGFVVRAAQDRALVAGPDKAPAGRLFALARAQPPAGHFSLALRGRPGQAAREVLLQVRFSPALALRAPQRPGGATGKGAPVPCRVVRVWEEAAGKKPLGRSRWAYPQPWPGVAAALRPARHHLRSGPTLCPAIRQPLAHRGLPQSPEKPHQGFGTGLGAEKLQLQTAERRCAAVARLSVVALALVDLREKSRLHPELPATAAGLETTFLLVLAQRSRRPVVTVRDVYYALAGHLGRTGDGPPGGQTLWRGLMTLRLLVDGVRMASLLQQL